MRHEWLTVYIPRRLRDVLCEMAGRRSRDMEEQALAVLELVVKSELRINPDWVFSEYPPDSPVTIRLTPTLKQMVRAAAERDRRTMTNWINKALQIAIWGNAVIKGEQMKDIEVYITKGTRVRAEWFHATDPPSSLAGMQLKFNAQKRSVVGTIRHFYADMQSPETAKVRIALEPDDGIGKRCSKCGVNEIEIHPKWIVEVLEQ